MLKPAFSLTNYTEALYNTSRKTVIFQTLESSTNFDNESLETKTG